MTAGVRKSGAKFPDVAGLVNTASGVGFLTSLTSVGTAGPGVGTDGATLGAVCWVDATATVRGRTIFSVWVVCESACQEAQKTARADTGVTKKLLFIFYASSGEIQD